jgi:hypothetical protein
MVITCCSAGLFGADIKLDYSSFHAKGSPLLFGGVAAFDGAPWDQYLQMGLSGIRDHIDPGKGDFVKNKGLTYIAITNYNNWSHKVPDNWDDYENWVKDLYSLVKGKADFLEVWNEPGPGFLDVGGTPYDDTAWVWKHLQEIYGTANRTALPKFTKAETYTIDNWTGNSAAQERDFNIRLVTAYMDIYYHTVKAIRSIDPNIPIGGPAAAGPHIRYLIYGFLGGILTDPRLARNDVGFASYHTYYYIDRGMNPIYFWRRILREYGRSDLPVFMTEWNQDGGAFGDAQCMQEAGISFVGQRLCNFFNTGMDGAFYFTLGDPYQGWCFYSGSTIAPKSRTYFLMAKQLGLGLGPSTVVGFADSSALAHVERTSLKQCCEDTLTGKFVEPEEYATVMGAINYSHKPVAVLVNWQSQASRTVTIDLTGLSGLTGTVPMKVYLASANNDATAPTATVSAPVTNGTISYTAAIPKLSVMGLLVDAAVQPPAAVPVKEPKKSIRQLNSMSMVRVLNGSGSPAIDISGLQKGLQRITIIGPDGKITTEAMEQGPSCVIRMKSLRAGVHIVSISTSDATVTKTAIVVR